MNYDASHCKSTPASQLIWLERPNITSMEMLKEVPTQWVMMECLVMDLSTNEKSLLEKVSGRKFMRRFHSI